jgi:CheY-like chemotaxis protein
LELKRPPKGDAPFFKRLVAETEVSWRCGSRQIFHNGGVEITVRILVVDDEPGTRNAFNASLVSQGHEVWLAGNGFQALEMLGSLKQESTAPELVLTDLKMPGLNGLDLIRCLRPNFSQLIFILMTGYGDEQVQEEAVALGALYMEKPIRPEVLMQTINCLQN